MTQVTDWTPEELAQMPRAWKVSDDYEGHGEIVYARNPGEARRLGFHALDGLCEEESLEVERAPEFDDLKGRSLRQAQLEGGWWFTCHGPDCRNEVRLDETEYEGDETPIVDDRDRVFCSAKCQTALDAYYQETREREWRVVADAVEKWPGITIESWQGNRYAIDLRPYAEQMADRQSRPIVGACTFRFPGGQYTAEWVWGCPDVFVHGHDESAFRAFLRSIGKDS